MNIHINGEPFTLAINANVIDALSLYLSQSQQKVSYAVAVNSDFVSKNQYSKTLLKEGDSIDVLFPIHGG